jgi:autotransporter translocation and assembly factor TamB
MPHLLCCKLKFMEWYQTLLATVVALAVLVAGFRFWLYKTLSGRRVLRYFGVRTNVRGNAHSDAKGGFGASAKDRRNG